MLKIKTDFVSISLEPKIMFSTFINTTSIHIYDMTHLFCSTFFLFPHDENSVLYQNTQPILLTIIMIHWNKMLMRSCNRSRLLWVVVDLKVRRSQVNLSKMFDVENMCMKYESNSNSLSVLIKLTP